MKKYVVIERSKKSDSFEFVNTETTGLGDIWYSVCTYRVDESIKGNLKPLIFNSKSEAVKYKDVQQSIYEKDWFDHYPIYKNMGYSKPKWKVEEYSGDLFS